MTLRQFWWGVCTNLWRGTVTSLQSLDGTFLKFLSASKLMLQCEAGSARLSTLEIHLGITITVSMTRLPRLQQRKQSLSYFKISPMKCWLRLCRCFKLLDARLSHFSMQSTLFSSSEPQAVLSSHFVTSSKNCNKIL